MNSKCAFMTKNVASFVSHRPSPIDNRYPNDFKQNEQQKLFNAYNSGSCNESSLGFILIFTNFELKVTLLFRLDIYGS